MVLEMERSACVSNDRHSQTTGVKIRRGHGRTYCREQQCILGLGVVGLMWRWIRRSDSRGVSLSRTEIA